jgi:hypothetical protein
MYSIKNHQKVIQNIFSYYYYYYYYYYCRASNGNIWVKKTYFLVFIHRFDTKASILLFKSCVRVTSNRMTKEFV